MQSSHQTSLLIASIVPTIDSSILLIASIVPTIDSSILFVASIVPTIDSSILFVASIAANVLVNFCDYYQPMKMQDVLVLKKQVL